MIATNARVALGDHIAAAMGVQTAIVLIGERPGLSVADSVGIYLTHLPRVGRTDADRTAFPMSTHRRVSDTSRLLVLSLGWWRERANWAAPVSTSRTPLAPTPLRRAKC
ncbi:hypothetical protein GCM10020255_063960 [Rhodococcus baikonurensis]